MENESLGEGSECVLGYLPLDILPARLLCLFTRWSGTAQLQVVCRGWRDACCRGGFASLLLVTASADNRVLCYGAAGDFRVAFTPLPWRVRTSVDPCDACETSELAGVRRVTHAMTAAWPTCLCVAPRRFFVSQYGVRGVVAYRIGSDAKLRFEKTLGADAFSYPEGLASVSAFLIVATCEGLIVTLDVHTGSVVHRVLCGEPLTLWCVLARRCRGNRDNLELYLTAHSAGDEPYDEATLDSSGVVLRCTVEGASGRVSPPASHARGLNRPSGLCFDGGDLLVTSFVTAHDGSRVRTVARLLDAAPANCACGARGARHRLQDGLFESLCPLHVVAAADRSPVFCGWAPHAARWPVDGSVPWGLATAERRGEVWVCGHGRGPTRRAASTGAVLAEASGDDFLQNARATRQIPSAALGHRHMNVVVCA